MQLSPDSIRQEEKLKDRLLYIKSRAEAGDYGVALAAVRKARTSWSDSVYLSALERQMGNLVSLSNRNALSAERKAEYLEPLSGIIDCAIARLEHRQSAGTPPSQTSPVVTPPPADAERDREEAIDKLKVQYFKQAGNFLAKGAYPLALAEIRRVYVIDPDNQMAKQYESIIEKLQNVAVTESHVEPTPAVTATSIPAPSPVEEATLPALEEALVEAPELPVTEPVEEISEPPEAHRLHEMKEPPAGWNSRLLEPESRQENQQSVFEKRTSKTGRRLSPWNIAAILTLVLIGGTVVILSLSSNEEHAAGKVALNPQPVAQAAKPVQTAETPAAQTASTAKERAVEPAADAPAHDPVKTAPQVRAARGPERPKQDTPPPEKTSAEKTSAVDVLTEEIHAGTQNDLPTAQHPAVEPNEKKSAEPATTPSDPEPFIALEKEPQIVKLETPTIPDFAWQGNSDLQVVARVRIDVEGKPIAVKILKSSNSVIEKLVSDALMSSKFTPGINGKNAVVAWLTIPLKFKRSG